MFVFTTESILISSLRIIDSIVMCVCFQEVMFEGGSLGGAKYFEMLIKFYDGLGN